MSKREANLENEHFFQQLITDGLLKVTRSGRVFNLKTKRELGRFKSEDKYRSITWKGNKHIQVHRLVWGSFKGVPVNPTLVINHLNGKPGICSLKNLELVTDGENKLHAYANGFKVAVVGKGSANPCAKFTDAQVRKFRKLHSAGKLTQRDICVTMKVTQATVSSMLNRKTYFDVH